MPIDAQDEGESTGVGDDPAGRLASDDRRRQASRLDAVQRLGLLDTPAEEAFDSLTRLAATLLGAPASFVSIVDADRDFYKSQFGFPAPLADARELRDETFCHHAIGDRDPLVIADTHADPAWKAMPTVESLGVRAYLGVPLWVGDEPIGSFCVIDHRPREWSALEVETLTQLTRSAAREIELRAALRDALAGTERGHALARRNAELVAVVAHDLRTPLQVVAVSAALLARSTDEANQAHAKRMAKAVASMSRLVDDLLAPQAVDGTTSQRLDTLDSARLLHDAVDTMGMVAARAGQQLQVGDVAAHSPLRIDYAQMLRVLCNLIGNCIKYCGSGSAVVLSSVREGDDVTLLVSDNGPGMTAEEQARAFDRGWQGAHVAGPQGAGLGLAIVRSLVEAHGGTVTLASVPTKGTTVRVRLPAAG